ncbi:hypothetical protein [Plantactinospora sp. DSM 117369]
MTSRRRSLGSTPLWLLTALGLATTAFGVYLQTSGKEQIFQIIAGALAAFGGAIVGAATSLYVASGDGRDTLLAVREMLAHSLDVRLRSTEAALSPIRRHWHYYHLTKRGGRFRWRHTDYHFEQTGTPGSIVLNIADTDPNGDQRYRSEAAIRGDRLILVESPEEGSTEGPIVAITPFFTEVFRRVRPGFALLRSWDGEDMVTRCIWSTSALVPSTGQDVSDEDGRVLDDLWERSFLAGHHIFPSVGHNPPGPARTAGPGLGVPPQRSIDLAAPLSPAVPAGDPTAKPQMSD